MAFVKISALPESTTTTDLALAGVETGTTVKMSNSIRSAQVVTALGFTPAPLASPTFTGTPAAPTPTAGDNSTTIATTAFVDAAITGIGGAAAWGHITGTLASQTDLGTALALKAPLASPVLTGTPTAPTAMLADNSTTIATTAFLKGQGLQAGLQFQNAGTNIGSVATETIVNFTGAGVTGSASTGTITVTIPGSVSASWGSITGTLASQTDLSTALALKAPLASPTFTGTPAAPTPTAGDNSTKLATTAFVGTAVAAGGGGSTALTLNSQTGTAYTLVLGDVSSTSSVIVDMNNAAANAVTIPPNSSVAAPLLTPFYVRQEGAGITSIVAGAGVTILPTPISARVQGSMLGAVQIATDNWAVWGDFS